MRPHARKVLNAEKRRHKRAAKVARKSNAAISRKAAIKTILDAERHWSRLDRLIELSGQTRVKSANTRKQPIVLPPPPARFLPEWKPNWRAA